MVCESLEAAASADDDGTSEENAGIVPSESSVSFAFGAEQDFRLVKRKDDNP